MKVVLLQDQKGLGKKGEVIEVKDGYAVNFIIPQKIGEVATPESIERATKIAKQKKKDSEDVVTTVQSLVGKVSKKTFQVKANAGGGGRIYAALKNSEIESSLKKLWGIEKMEIDIKIDLAQPVKELGKYPIDVDVTGGSEKAKVEIVLEVVGE